MELSNLNPISFAETDADTVKTEIIKKYEEASGRTLAQGDPVRLFLLTIADVIIHQRELINFTGKMNLLAYAEGDYLDHLGALLDVGRIQSQPASVTLKFTLSTTENGAMVIPKGTRVTGGNEKIYFAVDEDTTIPSGEKEGTVKATCTENGTKGNGFAVGTLKKLVDPLPFVSEVSNTTVSAGGGDTEADDSYRERIHEAPESFSDAGSLGAYEFFAKSANADIIDVNVSSPAAGEVQIVPLLSGGEIPEQEVLDDVLEVCNAEKVRPLTDKVTAKAPTTVSYDINASYYINTDDKSQSTSIQNAVTKAVSEYVLWQKSRLGRDIDPSKLYEMMVQAGAKKVTVTSPVIKTLQQTELAVAGKVTVNFLGGGKMNEQN